MFLVCLHNLFPSLKKKMDIWLVLPLVYILPSTVCPVLGVICCNFHNYYHDYYITITIISKQSTLERNGLYLMYLFPSLLYFSYWH